MRTTVLILASALALFGCRTSGSPPFEEWRRQVEEPISNGAIIPEEVSLIRLIANAQDYDGRFIRVTGYLHMEFERDAIFIRQEDCEQWLETNSVSIGVSRTEIRSKMQELSNRYVMLEGEFYYRKGDTKGTIWRISKVEPNFIPSENSTGRTEAAIPNHTAEPISPSQGGSSQR